MGVAVSLVILDCDGVLVDSEPLVLDVRLQMLAELGLEISQDELIDSWLGTPREVFLDAIESRLGHALPHGWVEAYEERCRTAFERGLGPVPGIEAALDGLAARGIRTCVASSGTHAKMTMTLGLTGLLPRFEGRIYSGTQVARGKPAPDLFVFAARQMGCPVGECVVVEDSVAGVAAAMAARMRVIAFGSGVTPRNRLERPGVLVIDDMAELPTVVVTLDNATAG